MARRILLLISFFCYAPFALGESLPEKNLPTLKAFINPITGNFDQAPKKTFINSRQAVITSSTTEPEVIDSPVAGGGKMIRVNGLVNSDFVVHKTKKGWQTQCHLVKNHDAK